MSNHSVKSCLLPSQRGFSLVELMIAITIGFVIVGAIGYLFIGSRQSFRTTDAMSRIQENARYALQTMAHDVRLAGNPGCGAPIPTSFVTGVILGWDSGTAVPAAVGIPAVGTGSRVTGDAIQLTVPHALLGFAAGDCAYSGGLLTTVGTAPDTVTYYVGTNQSGGRSLYRYSSVDATAAGPSYVVPELADNVWDMQVVYGTEPTINPSTPGYGSASQYNSAGTVPAWNQVVSARINLLMVSADNALSGPQTYQYYADTANLRSAMTPAAGAVDRLRLHQVFTTTVGLRNRLL